MNSDWEFEKYQLGNVNNRLITHALLDAIENPYFVELSTTKKRQ